MTKTSKLTSSELANLWNQYINDSMAVQVNTYLLKHVSDKKTGEILKHAVDLSYRHLSAIPHFLTNDNYSAPIGFSEKDVNLEAPALFSDDLCLVYLQVMTLHGLTSYSFCLTGSVRKDQRNFYKACLSETGDLYDTIIETMLEKGIFSKPPVLSPTKNIDFITNKQYMAGWFGKKRPLNSIEISGLHYNMQKTIVKVVLELGFSQVVQSKEIRDFFLKGLKLCEKQFYAMGNVLRREYLPVPRRWESEVSNSTIAPFSDKLMLFHVVSLISVTMGYYGTALSHCQRRDLSLLYSKQIAEIGLYGEDGFELMIKNGWMEQMPQAENRLDLANKTHQTSFYG